MKNKILHNVVATIFALIVILPFAIQTVHALHNHEHLVCTAKVVKHFHDQDADCSFFHMSIKRNLINFVSDFELPIHIVFNLNPTFYYFKGYQNQNKLKSSRAPPSFIV